MNPEETVAPLPDEQIKLPEEKKSPLIPRIIIFVIGAMSFVLAVAGLVLVSQLAQDSQDESEIEESNGSLAEESEESSEELSESMESSEVDEETAGPIMVYTYGDELRLLNADDSSVLLDTLDNPYSSTSTLEAYPVYPKWSPDGLKVLYSDGLELKVYDLDADTISVIYTAHEQGLDAGVWYQTVTRYCWKDNDSVFFVADVYQPGAGTMIDTHLIKEINLSTLAITDWGEYEMQSGFGGVTSDPAVTLKWHFSDLLGLSHEIYYSGDNVYVQTYISDARSWVEVPQSAVYSVVADTVVDQVRGTEDFDVTTTEIGTYESDASIELYVLSMMGSAPVNFQYLHTDVAYVTNPLVSADCHGIWDLQLDEEEEYLYYTEIENSTELASALDAEYSALIVNASYPQSYIKKVNIDTEDVELVVEGLDFDLR